MLRKVLSYIKETLISNKKSSIPKTNIYKKVETYDVPLGLKDKLILPKIKIENSEPEFVSLNQKQKQFLMTYLNDTYLLYRKQEIHIDNDLLKAFDKLEEAVKSNNPVQKYWIDLILYDMDKSYYRVGNPTRNFYSYDDEIM